MPSRKPQLNLPGVSGSSPQVHGKRVDGKLSKILKFQQSKAVDEARAKFGIFYRYRSNLLAAIAL